MQTPDGTGIVTDTDIFKDTVRVRLLLDDDKPVEDDNLAGDESIYSKDTIKPIRREKSNAKGSRRKKNSTSEGMPLRTIPL